jgi:glycosyltransferase involved in cell wall biosynthesis
VSADRSPPSEALRLSGLVICLNEEARIGACLASLAFCDEVVVVDSGSTDRTLELARSHGARIFERPYTGQNDQKDFGRTVARGDWLFVLDADEVASPELAEEVRAVAQGGAPADVDAYRIPFRNRFRGVWVRRAGYYPDPHVRLVRRAKVHWDKTAPVHDRVVVEGRIGALSGHVDHFSFRSLAHFLEKSERYAEGFARSAHAQGRRASVATIALHTVTRFVKCYLVKGGFLEGPMGLVISGLQAFETFQKYARLWELGRFGPEAGGERDRDVG